MESLRCRALTLANEHETRGGGAPPADVVARAQAYFDFLCGVNRADGDNQPQPVNAS